MYLNLDFITLLLNNYFHFEGGSFPYSISSDKGYELIDHAYDLLQYEEELYRSDIIANLRKAVNYRVSDLRNCFGLDKLKFNKLKSDQKLEKLQELGVVKSLLIKKLLTIRNGIEYCANTPPIKEECEELIDIVWYFYKSTDRYCEFYPESLLVEWGEEREFNFIFDFDFKEHKTIKFFGRLPDGCITEQKKYEYSLPIINTIIKDCTDTDKNLGAKLYHMYYEGEINVANIHDYIELLSIVLCAWGSMS